MAKNFITATKSYPDLERLPPSLGDIVRLLVPILEGIQGVITAGHLQNILIEIGSIHYSLVRECTKNICRVYKQTCSFT